jgi:hypothetical protein
MPLLAPAKMMGHMPEGYALQAKRDPHAPGRGTAEIAV